MRADLTPPQDLDAERSVLGSMLMSKDAISDTVEILKGRDFYRPAHETIFDAILSLYSRGEPADAITVGAELERTDQLDRIGDRVYLADLLGSVSIAENASYYARIVSDKAVLRRLVDASMRISQMAYQGQGDVADTVDAAGRRIPLHGLVETHAGLAAVDALAPAGFTLATDVAVRVRPRPASLSRGCRDCSDRRPWPNAGRARRRRNSWTASAHRCAKA